MVAIIPPVTMTTLPDKLGMSFSGLKDLPKIDSSIVTVFLNNAV